MPKFYGKDSSYLVRKEYSYFFWNIFFILLPLAVILLLFLLAPPVVTLAVTLIAILVIIKAAQPFFKALGEQGFKFYRGSQGEKNIRKLLMELPEDFSVFEDVHVGEDKGNIDFVVVAPSGIFCLEVKSHGGFIDFDGFNLTLNTRVFKEHKDYLRQVHGEMWALKNYIQEKTGKNLHIYPVLVFASVHASMNFGYNPVRNVYIVQKDFLFGLLTHFPLFNFQVPRQQVEDALIKTVS